jgi:hypothetical protein
MSFFAIAVTAIVLGGDTVTLREQIDLFDPSTGGFLGTERTWFSSDGRRLREEITDASGTQSLLYLVLHDGVGREAGAIYVARALGVHGGRAAEAHHR